MSRKRRIFVILLALALLAAIAYRLRLSAPVPAAAGALPPPASQRSFTALSANVGNSNLGCAAYWFKLCDRTVEENIAAGIQALAPDVIGLQELLADWQCAERTEEDSAKVCSQEWDRAQIQRLVGPGYTILCDARRNFTCLAVKQSFASITECDPGSYCLAQRTTSAIEGCENNFASLVASLETSAGQSFDVAVLHLPARGSDCRAAVLRELFETSTSEFFNNEQLLLMGDINLDPWRGSDSSQQAWAAYFDAAWLGRPSYYHSGIAESNPPRYTIRLPFFDRTIDVMASNFLVGSGMVLGESPDTQRLDGGEGMDHRALFATLYFPEDG